MKTNNYVKKHMDQLHRPATHVDRKRQQLLEDESHCREGIDEYLSDKNDSELSSTFVNND